MNGCIYNGIYCGIRRTYLKYLNISLRNWGKHLSERLTLLTTHKDEKNPLRRKLQLITWQPWSYLLKCIMRSSALRMKLFPDNCQYQSASFALLVIRESEAYNMYPRDWTIDFCSPCNTYITAFMSFSSMGIKVYALLNICIQIYQLHG